MVGERGTTLSGGQQARVSIARALYARPELIVADDPLAAVDAVVAKVIFNNICNYVRSTDGDGDQDGGGSDGDGSATPRRGALLVLNQLQLLPLCDHVVFMEGGVAAAQVNDTRTWEFHVGTTNKPQAPTSVRFSII